MSCVVSVPLSKDLEKRLDDLVLSGVGPDRASVMRMALKGLLEKQAIDAVLRAEKETPLRGHLRKILFEN